ncbi:MAG: peptidylprolyl isomerase, partial [Planctomycetota bacterium]
IMSRKQVSQKQWRMMLRARVMLRKLAAEGLDVPAEAVREEFHRRYGRKVVVRHIQTDALSEAQKVRKLAQKEGADFAELAREHSVNPSGRSGGELPPIGRGSDSIPAGIREAALAMKEPGELSNPVQVGDSFHILRLVRTIEPEDVKFEEVEAEMRQAVRERLLAARQQQVLRELLARADVEYVHPTLKHQHRAAQPDAPLQP